MDEKQIQTADELRWLADGYEQAQSIRIRLGERIRSILRGVDETFQYTPSEEPDNEAIDAELKAIAHGESPGPVPWMGRSYRRYYEEERDTFKDMMSAWKEHPVYEWLNGVRGIGPTLGCKILSRLDPAKADHASSFWAYCGLATVPGVRYRCPECGLDRGWPPDYKVSGKHQKLGGTGPCKGLLKQIAGPEDGIRVAQPRPGRGQKMIYDNFAKKTMYLIGTSFLKAGGEYEKVYREHRARLEVDRPGWADGRKHLTALRCTEKLFLAHLWQVWRLAVGLPISVPYCVQELGHDPDTLIDPWEMVEGD